MTWLKSGACASAHSCGMVTAKFSREKARPLLAALKDRVRNNDTAFTPVIAERRESRTLARDPLSGNAASGAIRREKRNQS
jgi:hypothetical protein